MVGMRRNQLHLRLAIALLGVALLWASGAWAQTQAPPPPQFAFLGFIQAATLDASVCGTPPADPRLAGGTMTVNGITMIVPCNSIIQLPANTMTWADLFDPDASAPVGTTYIGYPANPVPANPLLVGKTGLALADNPMPFPSFEVSVNGNVVGKNPDGTDRYMVGLIVPITQQGLNASSGIVSYIDYAIGAIRVGGKANDPGSGTLVQFNDPVGRWGVPHSPDPRFSGDSENTTIRHSTGIPLCIPRVAPPAIDPECPLTNRPLNGDSRFPTDPFLAAGAPLKSFTMPAPVLDSSTGQNTVTPDAYKQVPLMVGDQVNYAGTLYKINPASSDNTAANMYVSAHTVEDVTGIFTAPGVPPAYVYVEAFLIGSGGASIQGILQEASTRLTVVGFTTDPTRLVDIYAIDVNPCTGQETRRLLATTDPATDAIVGRFVLRVLGGNFMPPTRMYVMKSRTQILDPVTLRPVPLIAANGIATGQFALPNFEYVFPENHKLGDPIIPNNYQDLLFLALGSGHVDTAGIPGQKIGDSTSPILGQLDPWPGFPAPTKVDCTDFGATPLADAGPDRAIGTGASVTLTGTVTWDANDTINTTTPRVVLWTQIAGPGVTLGPITRQEVTPTSTVVTTSFTAPSTPTTLTFQLSGADKFGTGNDAVNITALQAPDTVQFVVASWAIQRGQRGPFGKLNVTATTSDPTALLSLSQVSVGGSVIFWGTGSNTPSNPTTFDWVEIKGATQPVSLTITSTKGGTATVTCGQPNAKGVVTCP